jgi:glycosyltransferase involved in cell wall biosynthesis
MEPARVALDVQALQDGSGAAGDVRRRVAELAGELARSDRLAAALLAPELPLPEPDALPPELRGPGRDLLDWDSRDAARSLMAAHPGLVHHVPAPLLHSGPGDHGGLVASWHWAEAGAERIVTIDAADGRRLLAPTPRLAARLEWIRLSTVVELAPGLDATALGIDPAQVATPSPAPLATTPATTHSASLATTPGATRPPSHPATHPASHLPLHLAVYGPFPPGGGGIGAYNARFVEALAGTVSLAGAASPPTVDAVTTTGLGWTAPAGVMRVHAEAFGTDIRPASYDAVIYTLGNSDGHLATIEAALRHPGWLWLHEARLAAVATSALAGRDDEAFEAHLERLLERAYPGRPPLAAARKAGRSHLALAAAGVGLVTPLAERAAGLFVNSHAARHSLLLDLPPMAWHPPVVVLPPACPPVRPRRPERPAAEPADTGLAVAFGVVSMGKRPDLLVDAAALAGCRLAFVGPCPDVLQEVIRNRAATRGITHRVEVAGTVDDQVWWGWMDRAEVAVQLRDSSSGEMSAAVLDALSAGVPVLTNLASAQDYPEGTVRLLPDATADAGHLAAALEALLADPAAKDALTTGGQRFAAAHQMEHLAAAVLAAIAPAHAPQ